MIHSRYFSFFSVLPCYFLIAGKTGYYKSSSRLSWNATCLGTTLQPWATSYEGPFVYYCCHFCGFSHTEPSLEWHTASQSRLILVVGRKDGSWSSVQATIVDHSHATQGNVEIIHQCSPAFSPFSPLWGLGILIMFIQTIFIVKPRTEVFYALFT